jgi:hypothetical protein
MANCGYVSPLPVTLPTRLLVSSTDAKRTLAAVPAKGYARKDDNGATPSPLLLGMEAEGVVAA